MIFNENPCTYLLLFMGSRQQQPLWLTASTPIFLNCSGATHPHCLLVRGLTASSIIMFPYRPIFSNEKRDHNKRKKNSANYDATSSFPLSFPLFFDRSPSEFPYWWVRKWNITCYISRFGVAVSCLLAFHQGAGKSTPTGSLLFLHMTKP